LKIYKEYGILFSVNHVVLKCDKSKKMKENINGKKEGKEVRIGIVI